MDDEPAGLENIELNLKAYCPEIVHIQKASNALDAESALLSQQFDVLFLDIQMPVAGGFDLLDKLKGVDNIPPCIMVTAHQNFGLEAIKAGVIDYLVKPIDATDLKRALQRVVAHIQRQNDAEQHNMNLNLQLSKRISIPHNSGFELVELGNIIRLEADSSYTAVHIQEAKNIIVSKTLKDFEQILPKSLFVRVHRSHIVNLHFVAGFSNQDGGTVIMKNGDQIVTSRRKLPYFQEQIKNYSILLG